MFFNKLGQRTKTKEILHDTVGSLFGAALCTAKLESNRKHDFLLVGAPALADDDIELSYDVGAVYVYEVTVSILTLYVSKHNI